MLKEYLPTTLLKEYFPTTMLKEYSEKLLQIYHQDWYKIVNLSLLNFIVTATSTLGLTVSTSLFLKRVGAEFLPQMYIINAILIFLGTFVLFISPYMKKVKLLIRMSLISGLLIMIIRVIMVFGISEIYFLLYALSGIIYWVFYTQFWSLSVEICNVREGKRIFSFTVSAGLLGGGAAGVLTRSFVNLLGTDNLLFLWSISFFILAYYLNSKFTKLEEQNKSITEEYQLANQKEGLTIQIKNAFTYFLSSNLIKTLIISFMLYAIVIYFLDFQFNKLINIRFPRLNELTGFYGVYSACFYGLTFFIQLFLANRIIRHIGTGNVMISFPSVLSIGFTSLIIKFSYISGLFARFIRDILGYSLIDSVYPLLYSPLKRQHRDHSIAFIEGVVIPLGTALAGVMLLSLRKASDLQVSIIGLSLSLLWLYSCFKLKNSYQSALIENIIEKTLPEINQPIEQLTDLSTKRTLIVLNQAMRDKNDKVSLFAIQQISNTKDSRALNLLINYLKENPSPVRKASIIKALGSIKETNAVLILSKYLDDPDPRVRANAVESLGDIGGPEVKELVKPYINDTNPRIAINAGIILWKYGDKETGIKVLKQLMSYPDEIVRTRAIYGLGEIGTDDALELLIEASKDKNPKIRMESAKGLKKLQSKKAVIRLIEMLNDKDKKIQKYISEELIHIKDIEDLLINTLNSTEEEKTKEKIIEILSKRREAENIILNYISEELKKIYQRILWINTLNKEEKKQEIELLQNELHNKNQKSLDKILKLLSNLEGSNIFKLIIKRLKDKDERTRAELLELIETLNIKYIPFLKLIIPILEDRPIEELIQIAKNSYELIENHPKETYIEILETEPDEWIKGYVLYILGESQLDEFLPIIIKYTEHKSGFLRETALVVLNKISNFRARLTAKNMLNDPDINVKTLAQSLVS